MIKDTGRSKPFYPVSSASSFTGINSQRARYENKTSRRQTERREAPRERQIKIRQSPCGVGDSVIGTLYVGRE